MLASDLNSEFNNLLNNSLTLISPFTASPNAGGFKITNYGGTDAPTSVTDVALNAFVQSGTGAAARTLQSKIRESPKAPEDYTSSGLQSAITASSAGGIVKVAAGTTASAAALTGLSGVTLQGDAKTTSAIAFSTASARGLDLTNALRAVVKDVKLTPPASPTNLAIYADTSQELTFERIHAVGWDGGAQFLGTGGVVNIAWFNNIITLNQCAIGASLTKPNLDWQGINLTATGCDFSSLPPSGTRAAVRIRTGSYDSTFTNTYYEHGALLSGGNVFQCEGGVTRIKGGFAIGGNDGTKRVGSYIAASAGAIVIVEGVTGFNFWTNLVTADGAGTIVYVMPGTFTGSFDVTTRFVETSGGKVIDLSQTKQTFTATLTGCTTSPTATVTYKRDGDIVTMIIPSLAATSNSALCTLTGLPAAITPATTQFVFCNVVDTGANFTGCAQIQTAGSIALLKTNDMGVTGFTASGLKGIQGTQVITYSLF